MEMFPLLNGILESLRINRVKVSQFMQRADCGPKFASKLLTNNILSTNPLAEKGPQEEGSEMKWFVSCWLALAMVCTAFAGEDPYIAIVGNDVEYNPFYVSQQYQQFLYYQELFSVPICFGNFPSVVPQTRVGGLGCEQFRSNAPMNQPDICDSTGVVNGVAEFAFLGEINAVIRKDSAGYYEWYIRLPNRPNGEINLVFQCGVLKPNTFAFEEFNSIKLCAAETGERIGYGWCTRDQVGPNVSPIIQSSLPTIIAMAYPGPYSLGFSPFHLTAYRNPGTYSLTTTTDTVTHMKDSASLQVLDGTSNARIMLKACMDETVITKIPVTGQVNALGEVESDLEAGDLIFVRMNIPINNKVDIYCSPQSVRLQGIGEVPF